MDGAQALEPASVRPPWAKHPFKKLSLRGHGVATGSARRARMFCHLALGVGFGLDIGVSPGRRHLRIAILRIQIFLVATGQIGSRAFEIDRRNHLKRILFMRRRHPGHLRLVFAFVHGQRPLENARRDRSGHRTAVLATLHHHGDRVLRLFERRPANKPGDRIFSAVIGRLRGAGFARHLHIAQAGPAARAAVFIHDFPKTSPLQFYVRLRNLVPKISSHAGLFGPRHLAFFVAHGRAVLIQNFLTRRG